MEAEPKREETSILTIPSIPDELITEILLRLPVKFLLRFRCVSKSWLSLISSPRFVKIHLLLSVNNKDYTRYRVMFSVYNPERDIKDCALSSLLCDNSVTGAFDLDYPGRVPGEFPRIVGSTCGLICLAIWVGGFYDLFLWNPSVREYTKLPKFRPSGSKLYPFNFIYRNYFSFGFAYDELKDDYKVVGVFDINGLRSEVEIYSVKSNSWRRIKDLQGGVMRCVSGKLVDGKLLADGKLYWLDHGRNILSIDLADEKWTVVGIPLDLRLSDLLALGAFGGDICLFSGEIGNGGVDHVDVWVTKEYGVEESWTNIFTINSFDQSIAINPPIIMSNEGEILLRRASRFAKYNIKDDSIKYLDVTNYAQYHHAEIYVESLLCPF